MIRRRTIAALPAAMSALAALALAGCATSGPPPLASLPEPCLALRWEPTAEQSARFTAEAEPALRAYLALAAAGADPAPAFASAPAERRWAMGGRAAPSLSAVRDPWAADIAKLEPERIRLGGIKTRGRGLWRVFRADGIFLGTYDAMFADTPRGFALASLDLWNPGDSVRIEPANAFCHTPGDYEKWAGIEEEPQPAEPRGRRKRN